MANFLSKERNVFTMDKNNKTNYFIEQNERVTVETYDCYKEQIKNKNAILTKKILQKTNPATGPIFIYGINKGDILKVDVLKIKEKSNGIIYTGHEIGVNKIIRGSEFAFIDEFNDKTIKFKDVNISINKMIGVIGVAPEGDCISTSTSGRHGGNMDCKKITENSSLYLPVYHEGALLSIGDVHLAMSDGEVGGTGLEINAEVEIICSKANVGMNLQNPILTNEEGMYFISSGCTIEKAIENGIEDLAQFFKFRTGLSTNDLLKLFSLVCEVQINQVVNPQKSIRLYIPRYILRQFDIVI
ncbi:acetamidase/formamidase family protein [Staphylococcus roterodami]|nr:acetamidase/formamidase family protein [Staphylococcus roterodami]